MVEEGAVTLPAPIDADLAAEEGSIAITRHQETVAYLISRGRMDAIMETLDLLGNPAAMNALRAYEGGKMKFLQLSALNGDQG